jgi:hypothetical protein
MLVSNPRDEIDAWLHADVEPLAPPPGSFERIRQRARRRKAARAMASAAGAVVVIVAVVAVPQVVRTLRPGNPSPVAGRSVPVALPSAAGPTAGSSSKGGGRPASHSSTRVPRSSTSLSPTTSGTGPPAHFRPTSITQIGNGVGAVLGQAGVPGHCPIVADDCTSIAGTSNFGKSWYGISAPVVGAPAGSTGVSQLRYLNFHYGWAFGPALYATADGGATWTAQSPAGLRVTDLETAGNRAFALFARCTGSGGQYAASCTSYSLYSSAAGSGSWQPVAVPPAYRTMTSGSAGPAAAASLVLASGTAARPEAGAGYVLAPSGELLRGPLVVGQWQAIGHIPSPCQVGTAQASGQPAGTQLASGSAAAPQLVLSCDGPASAGSGLQTKTIYTSPDGATWQLAGTAPAAGTATSLAAGIGGLVVIATSAGIDYSADGGIHWQPASFTASAPARGFSYVGMTTATQGVAVPADSSLGEVFTTADSGRTWQASPIAG